MGQRLEFQLTGSKQMATPWHLNLEESTWSCQGGKQGVANRTVRSYIAEFWPKLAIHVGYLDHAVGDTTI
jgi:hypothetical protein